MKVREGLRPRRAVDRWVVLFLVASLVPLALLAFSSTTLAERAVRAEILARVETTSSVSASLVELEMTSVLDVVRSYATRTRLVEAIGDGTAAGRDEEMIEFQVGQLVDSRPGIIGAVLTDPSCVLTSVQPANPEIVGSELSHLDWCAAVTRAGRPLVSEAHRSHIAGSELVVAAISPVRSRTDGRPIGYLAAVYSLAEIQRLAAELAGAQDIALSIVDERGTVVVDPHQQVIGGLSTRADDPIIASGLAGNHGVTETERQGDAVLVGYAPIESLGWVVTAEVPSETAFTGVSDVRSTVILIAAGLGFVLLIAGALLARALAQRRHAQQAAKQSERRTRDILDSASDGFVSTDANGVVVAWNAAAERLFGWSGSEAIGRPVAELVVPADRRGSLEANLQQFLATGEWVLLDRRVEVEACHRDGRTFAVELAVTASLVGEQWQFNAFVHDISERLRHQAELAEARDRALEASRLKSEFLANMSHEIRTPMNGVLGMAALLLDTDLDPQQRDCTETVQRSGEALLTIIDDILDFSKIEAGRLDLEVIPFDIHAVAADVSGLFAAAADGKSLELVTYVHPTVPHSLAGDPGRIRQVLGNLLGNAVKFTERGEVLVEISTGRAEHQPDGDAVGLRVAVTDTGIGIADDVQAHIFDAFSQADASTTRQYGGTGLGLAICRELVGLMGGTIGVRSRLGEGSTFWFTVPLALVEEPAERVPRADLAGTRMLLVDDNATNRTVLARTLATWGVTVAEAEDADGALELLAAAERAGHRFDAALIDYHMPAMDGIGLATEIRAGGESELRLILLTSSGLRGQASVARQAGMDGYLTKPVLPRQLRECLSTVLGTGDRRSSPLVTRDAARPAKSVVARVLVAEDDPVNRKVAAGLLQGLGYDAEFATNGEEAVAAACRGGFDAILMDCQMPVLDGYEATRRIRRDAGAAGRVPIIALTASALAEDRQRCLDAGMDDHLAKPIRRDDLASALRVALRRRPLDARVDPPVAAAPDAEPEAIARGIASRMEDLFDGFDDVDLAAETRDLLDSYRTRSEALRTQIARAAEAADAEAVRRAAHSLKGMAANVGIDI